MERNRSRGYKFIIDKYTAYDILDFINLQKNKIVTYGIILFDGENIKGYLHFKNVLRIKTVKNLIPGAIFFPTQASYIFSLEYSDNSLEFGNPPIQGKKHIGNHKLSVQKNYLEKKQQIKNKIDDLEQELENLKNELEKIKNIDGI